MCTYVFCKYLAQKKTIIFLYASYLLFCNRDGIVYCAARTEALNVIQINPVLKGLMC